MNIVLSFIGKLPLYIVYCIYQIRIYNNEIPIYLIYNDYDSNIINKIRKYNVILIDYKHVKDNMTTLENAKNLFSIIYGLQDRKELFFRSFERFYLLRNLTKTHHLQDILFLEIDNLIYTDPKKILEIFKEKNINISFMIDNINRASTGLAYFKDVSSIEKLTTYFDSIYLQNDTKNKFLNEMRAVYEFYELNKDICYILPSIHEKNNTMKILNENYDTFNSIFDPSTYGIYLLGHDVFHTGGKIILYKKNKWGCITPDNRIKWLIDDGLKKPFIVENEKKILINNLHVHSKDLLNGLSKQYLD